MAARLFFMRVAEQFSGVPYPDGDHGSAASLPLDDNQVEWPRLRARMGHDVEAASGLRGVFLEADEPGVPAKTVAVGQDVMHLRAGDRMAYAGGGPPGS